MLQSLDLKAEVMLHSVEESIDWFQNNEHPDLNISRHSIK